MKIIPYSIVMAFTSATLLSSTFVAAQNTGTVQEAGASKLTGQDKVMMEKAASAACYADLARQVKGLAVSENLLAAAALAALAVQGCKSNDSKVVRTEQSDTTRVISSQPRVGQPVSPTGTLQKPNP